MRAEKQLLLDEIKETITGAKALVWTRYEKLNPDVSADFRMKLSETGGGFSVVRKRILLKAAAEAGIKLEEDALEGHIGLVYASEDPITTTKVLIKFSKDNNELFDVIGGQFDGQICSSEDVKAISKLPSQDEMRSQLLGLFEAPMSQTLSVMEALLTSVIYCLDNKSKEESE